MPGIGWRAVHLFALSGLAIAQPVLSLLGDNPTFFTAHDSDTTDIVTLAFVLVLVPPIVCAGLVAATHRLSPRRGEQLHLVLVALFGFLLVVPFVDELPAPGLLVIAVAIGGAIGTSVLYLRAHVFRSVLSVLALAPPVFVALFLFVSPVHSVAFPDDVDAVEASVLLDDLDTVSPSEDPGLLADRIADRFPPVFLLVFDELLWPSLVDENGEVDATRYPNFGRLAATSHVFTDATAPGFQTQQSIPILLSGRRELADAPVYSRYPDNVFTLLGGIYDVSSSDPLVDLCPPSVCDGMPPTGLLELLGSGAPQVAEPAAPPAEDDAPFDLLLEDAAIVFGHLVTPDDVDVGLPSIGSSWGRFGRGVTTDDAPDPAPATALPRRTSAAVDPTSEPDVDAGAVDAARASFLESLITDDTRVADMRADIAAITARGVPQLDYLHVLLPHVPWRHHGDGSTYADLALPGYFDLWNQDETVATLGQQRHLLQLRFTDVLLGEYLDRLDALGLFDDATVIVTADHGISFAAGEHARGIFESNSGGIAPVPLFWKDPGQRSHRRHDEPVSPLDIVPTLARRLDVEIPWAVDGIDMFGELPASRDRFVAGFGGFMQIPPSYPDLVAESIATSHDRFGTGDPSLLYAAAGHAELIGELAAAFVDEPAVSCWTAEDTTSAAEAGDTGYLVGTISTGDPAPVDYAIVVDGVVAGTSRTYADIGTHDVYGLGDPEKWRVAGGSETVELHHILDGRLHPIPSC